MRGNTFPWGRRQVLKFVSGSAIGLAVASRKKIVSAQSSDSSITIEDQESDGDTVVVAEAQTNVESRLIIISDHQVDGTNIGYRTIELDPGASITNQTIELEREIPETQEIRAEIRTVDGTDELLARDGATVTVGEPIEAARPTVEIIEADPDAGFRLPYALFKPKTTQNTERPIYVQSNNDSDVETREELKNQLEDSGFRAAGRLQYPGLIAGLPRLPDDGLDLVQTLAIHTLQSDPGLDTITTDVFPEETLERVDKQLVNMIDDAIERLENDGYNVSEQVHMEGYSGGGTFTSRFAFLHPDRVSTISIGGTGATPLPHDELDGTRLPYPLGTADYEEIMGKEFDKQEWLDIDQFFFNGEEDQPLPDTDPRSYYGISIRYGDRAVDVFGKNRITERLPTTLSVYEEAGASVSSTVYEGVGHVVNSDMLDDLVAFHGEHTTAQHALFDLSVHTSATNIAVDESLTITVDIDNQVGREAKATPTLSVDDQQVSTAERDIPAGETKTVEFEHSFDTPGNYQLSVNGLSVDEPIEVVEQSPSNEDPDSSPADDSVSDHDSSEMTTEDQPGFGVMQTIAAIGGVGYLIKRRISNRD